MVVASMVVVVVVVVLVVVNTVTKKKVLPAQLASAPAVWWSWGSIGGCGRRL
jgi:hypothetical protein